jgi:hypothetical protein
MSVAVRPSIFPYHPFSSPSSIRQKPELSAVLSPKKESEPTDLKVFSWEESQRLTDSLSQKIFASQKDILSLGRKLPRAQGVVGDLPPSWGQKIPHDQSDSSRKDFFLTFKKSLQTIRDICHGKVIASHKLRFILRENAQLDPPTVSDRPLLLALKRAGITDTAEPIKISFVDEGSYGTVHKFEVNQKAYALKVFKQKVNAFKDTADIHGNPAEINNAAYIQKNIPNHPFARFYFGDIDSGYMVTDFIDDSPAGPPLPQLSRYDLSPWGIKHRDLDNEDNMKNGRIVDYGGIVTSKKEAEMRHVFNLDSFSCSGLDTETTRAVNAFRCKAPVIQDSPKSVASLPVRKQMGANGFLSSRMARLVRS